MGLQNQNMNLVLSTDAKPRLKWTPELHQRFIEAVNKLGGPEKATPKNLMRAMEIPGLTLYHLKSHLQKYRLGKSQSSIDSKQDGNLNFAFFGQVQRHLQLRIEAQGKYLQTVLTKAQETLAGYSSSSMGVEIAKTELSRLVSMVNSGCPTSSLSELTEVGGASSAKESERNQTRATRSSVESSLTSSESSGRDEEKQPVSGTHTCNTSLELTLDSSISQLSGKKRSVSDGICVEKPVTKRSNFFERLDLNAPLSD
ncbi:hypothetical protein ACFE04_024718 [Oxalis oulophora]